MYPRFTVKNKTIPKTQKFGVLPSVPEMVRDRGWTQGTCLVYPHALPQCQSGAGPWQRGQGGGGGGERGGQGWMGGRGEKRARDSLEVVVGRGGGGKPASQVSAQTPLAPPSPPGPPHRR